MASFWKPEACGQTVLPDRSILTGQKLVKMSKLEQETFWVIFKQRENILVVILSLSMFIMHLLSCKEPK